MHQCPCPWDSTQSEGSHQCSCSHVHFIHIRERLLNSVSPSAKWAPRRGDGRSHSSCMLAAHALAHCDPHPAAPSPIPALPDHPDPMRPQGICSWSVINKHNGPGTLRTGHGGVGPRRAHDRVSPGLPFLSASSSSPSPGPWLQPSALEGAPEEPSSGRQTPSVPREMDK